MTLAAGLAAAPAFAQGQGQRRGGFGNPGLMLLSAPGVQTRLNLTADQKGKLEGIQTRTREETRAAFQAAAGDRQAAGQKVRELNQKAETEALAVLTGEQKQQFEAIKAEQQQYQGLGRASLALLSVTGITAEQKTKLTEASRQAGAKRQELFQSAQGGGFEGIREKMQALETETNASVKAILNADQQKQFDTALEATPRGFGGRRRQQN
jgi:hypothetical protein